ncbi:MAG: hypothetical protein HY273_08590 [Gammaproteobacteria bacterium]|nr:hypothetical protein [Gammaproteobacteria bacterium]
MVTQEQHAVLIKGNNGATSNSLLTVSRYDRQARVARALKILGICWLSAIGFFFTFIPAFHLVSALVLLILGPVLAYKRYNTAFINDKVQGRCPACAQEITVDFETDDKLPKWTYCPLCKAPIQIVVDEPPKPS